MNLQLPEEIIKFSKYYGLTRELIILLVNCDGFLNCIHDPEKDLFTATTRLIPV